ncbi:MAG: TldD/PmbA family protein [Thermoplasmata archaeon]|nr:MAG: TldD/PmbA family protein [Thermoplasmata archaeon]
MDEYQIVKRALSLGAEYCDIRVEDTIETNVSRRNKELSRAVLGSEKGFGIRVLFKGVWGFFSSNSFSVTDLKKALDKAIDIAKAASTTSREKVELAETKVIRDEIIWKPKNNPLDVSIEEKNKMLIELEKETYGFNEIKSVDQNYVDEKTTLHFVNSEGTDVSYELTRVFLQVNLIARREGNMNSMRFRIGGTCGYEIFDKNNPIEIALEKSKKTVEMLDARLPPSGRFTVVADPELTGVFTHEAVGHACEADLVVSGESILKDRIGEKIAKDAVSIVDDPTIKNAFGSIPYDDEGVKARCKTLIKDGVLTEYILNRETAKKLGLDYSNGGARAQSFAYRPLVRMSNTMILPGDHSFEELIEDIKLGVFAKGTKGGQVDVVKGNFQFNTQEAYMIENGEITKLLKNFSLSGEILDTLKNIDALGKEMQIGDPGFCGKGQLVPVGDGGPFTRIKNVIVGGM